MANEISIIVRTTDAASRGFSNIGNAAVGMNAAIDAAGAALDSIDTLQQSGAQKAERLARAQLDVEQAMVDNEQAVIDLKQATLDLNQAEIDGKQAAVDVEQAQIDARQANLDATVAQQDYNKAVKEYGKGSDEAKQASIDLTQAQSDLNQANLDSEQATADLAQSQSDSAQATTDLDQATIDAKTSQLDLNEAQRAVDPTFIQQASQKFQELAPILAIAALAGNSLAASFNATRIAAIASAAASKAMAAATWLVNIAMRANPIGIVITLLVALAAGLVLAYKKSDTFRAIVQTAFRVVLAAGRLLWNGIKLYFSSIIGVLSFAGSKIRAFAGGARSALSNLVSFVRSIPGRVRGALSGMFSPLVNAASNAVNTVRSWLGGLVDFARSIPGQIGNTIKGAIPGFAHGGVVGQAASGATSSGLTMTGEQGPELLQLPPGTRVRSNPDTRRKLGGGGGGGGPLQVNITLDGNGLLEALRKEIRIKGGVVQNVLGR